MNYGVDVGATRLDDLDRRVVAQVEELVQTQSIVSVLDVGCGAGGLAVTLAKAGAMVTAVDVSDYTKEIVKRQQEVGLAMDAILFTQADVRSWLPLQTTTYDIVVLQRVLHYLPYNDARILLRSLKDYTDTLYLSVTGQTSAIAEYYGKKDTHISERWGTLDSVGRKLFSIDVPLCIYHEQEVLDLLQETGWKVTWSRVSDFGNIKVIASSFKSSL